MAGRREGSPGPAASGGDHDELPVGMPSWAPRAIAWILVLLLAVALLAGFLLPFARTVHGPFVLLPAQPSAAVLAPAEGALQAALVDEGSEVGAGEVLFLLRVPAAGRAEGDGVLEVRSPVAGLLLSLEGGRLGDPVQAGRVLAQVVAFDAPLVAVIDLPEDALSLVEPGQPASLLLAAYPAQRFGAVEAVIRRVDRIPITAGGRPVLRAYAEMRQAAIVVRGEKRPLLAGLHGEARIVVDRRPLLGARVSR